MAAKRKSVTKTPPQLTPEQRHHRQFRRALGVYAFNSPVLAGLIPFTQKHGRGAIQTLPNFDYASKHYPLVENRPDGMVFAVEADHG